MLDRAQQVDRVHRGQPAVAAAERRPGSFDDDDVVLGNTAHSDLLVVGARMVPVPRRTTLWLS